MADAGNLTIRLDDLKEPFKERAKRICGTPTALVEQFARAVLSRPAEEVWRFCFDIEDESKAPKELPILGRIPGGPLSEAVQEIEGYLHPGSLRHGPNAFFLRIDGKSMEDSINGVHDGDCVLLDPDLEVQSRQRAAVLLKDGTATFAVYIPKPDGTVRLHKLNPAFEDIIVRQEDIQTLLGYCGLVRAPEHNK